MVFSNHICNMRYITLIITVSNIRGSEVRHRINDNKTECNTISYTPFLFVLFSVNTCFLWIFSLYVYVLLGRVMRIASKSDMSSDFFCIFGVE